jgi:hypothetical protein
LEGHTVDSGTEVGVPADGRRIERHVGRGVVVTVVVGPGRRLLVTVVVPVLVVVVRMVVLAGGGICQPVRFRTASRGCEEQRHETSAKSAHAAGITQHIWAG